MDDFETGGGTKVPSEVVIYGQYLALPNSPTQDGYTFVGWYSEATNQNLFDFSDTRIIEDTILYAAYSNGAVDNTSTGTIEPTTDTTSLFGIGLYGWLAIGAGAFLLLGTKKGRKALGLKWKK